MSRVVTVVLALAVILFAITISGCSSDRREELIDLNNTSTASGPVPATGTGAPTIIPGQGVGYIAYGRVYLDGNIVPGAQVEAISVDGTCSTSNVTDKNGVYQLVMPDQKVFNITAKYQGLQHRLWPVRLTGASASNNIYMTSAPATIIMGKGTARGGPPGYDPAKFNFSGIRIMAVPTDINATTSTEADSDGSYYLEIRPDITYRLKADTMAATHFHLRNVESGYVSNVTMGTDETALMDYEIFLP